MAVIRYAGVAGIAFALAGCAFGPQMQRVAIDQNAMIADTANELMVVNILRARNREPLHFTSIAKATGSATLSGKASGNVAIKGATAVETTGPTGDLTSTATTPGVEVFTPALEASIVTGSNLDIAVFDTQEFYQGITTSLTSSQVAHYLHQGWPPELLMYLMIESVEFVPAAGGSPVIDIAWKNDPDDHAAMKRFTDFVAQYPIDLGVREEKTDYVAPVSDFSGSKLADFLQLDGRRFTIADRKIGGNKTERWLVRMSGGGDDVVVKSLDKAADGVAGCPAATDAKPPAKETDTSAPPDDRQPADTAPNYKLFSTEMKSGPSDHAIFAQGVKTDGTGCVNGTFQITLRSAEGIIYYLGETLREGNYMPAIDGIPLLSIKKQRPAETFVQARFRGENWYVPLDPELEQSRTSQIVALTQQLINLQKLSKDKPTTQSIRILQ
ncbi:hypothetical protein [Sphingopyxis sp.]|uniref:hypothetical protein n=1 Tax=Sphingopyxis sp. TaxID=1908224 RepID=UPI002D774CED|nr:hypothetical protein [Sphingopyxis sp.]HET6524579.1 hypothetical protein [Sphingopyxis sp.]